MQAAVSSPLCRLALNSLRMHEPEPTNDAVIRRLLNHGFPEDDPIALIAAPEHSRD